jgi:hypothetical protein
MAVGRVVDDEPGTSTALVGEPAPGEGFWFLVRGAGCADGSCDSGGGSQIGSRDAEVIGSGADGS